MIITTKKCNGQNIAIVDCGTVYITDAGSAMELALYIQEETGCNRFVLNKGAVAEDFFSLSNGLAGEILQKYINYHFKVAIVGSFDGYASRALHDFIYESNRGADFFFTATEDEAIKLLAEAK